MATTIRNYLEQTTLIQEQISEILLPFKKIQKQISIVQRNATAEARYFPKIMEPVCLSFKEIQNGFTEEARRIQKITEPVRLSLRQIQNAMNTQQECFSATFKEFHRYHSTLILKTGIYDITKNVQHLCESTLAEIKHFGVNDDSIIHKLAKDVVASKTPTEAYSKLEKLQMAINTIFPQILVLKPVILHMMQRLKKKLTWSNVVKMYRFLMDIVNIYQTLQGDSQICDNEIPNATTEADSSD